MTVIIKCTVIDFHLRSRLTINSEMPQKPLDAICELREKNNKAYCVATL